MQTTFDSEADAVYITLVPEISPGRASRTVEVDGVENGSVMLDFDAAGTLLRIEILGAIGLLDDAVLAASERIGTTTRG